MRAHFVSGFFCICSKNAFSVVISQVSSRLLRESICNPLSNKDIQIKIDIQQKIKF